MPARVEQTENHDRFEIFERYQPLLSSIARSILGNEAEDQHLLREVLELWLRVPDSEIAEARTFLVTTIAARATVLLASSEPQWVQPCRLIRRSEVRPCSSAALSPAKAVFRLTLKTLDQLPASERSAFFLRTVFNCKYREIGRIIGKDESECRKIVRKVKKHMLQNRSSLTLLDLSGPSIT